MAPDSPSLLSRPSKSGSEASSLLTTMPWRNKQLSSGTRHLYRLERLHKSRSNAILASLELTKMSWGHIKLPTQGPPPFDPSSKYIHAAPGFRAGALSILWMSKLSHSTSSQLFLSLTFADHIYSFSIRAAQRHHLTSIITLSTSIDGNITKDGRNPPIRSVS